MNLSLQTLRPHRAPGFYCKRDFYAASRRLELGNILRQWEVATFRNIWTRINRPVSLRSMRTGDRLGQCYRLTPVAAIARIKQLQCKYGYKAEDLLVDESAPDGDVVLQAEFCRSPRHLEMRYCLRSGVGVRKAYDSMIPTYGIAAVRMLDYLDASSRDCVENLLSLYPDSVIELSTYPYSVGMLEWNTLFWEVRNY